jgi:cytochrome c5
MAAGLLVAGVCPAWAQTPPDNPPVRWKKVSVNLPVSDSTFPPGDGAQIVNANCLMCHSEGMVMRQPPLAEAQWLDEVRKMREIFRAPIPAENDATLARYLAHINGPANPNAKAK